MNFFVFLVLILLHSTTSSRLECNFIMKKFLGLGEVYTCQFKYNLNITSPNSDFILSSTGTHLDQKSYDDVLAIDAKNKNIQYFPKGLEWIFKNLKAIDLQKNYFNELYQADLRHFKDLVHLDLGINNIEVLEDGVFDSNPNLEVLSLYGNKIYHIDLHVFDSLNKLNSLVLEKNLCIDKSARFDSSGVSEIIQNTKFMCQNSQFSKGRSMMQRRCSNAGESLILKTQLEAIEINLQNRISELKQVIDELKDSQCKINVN